MRGCCCRCARGRCRSWGFSRKSQSLHDRGHQQDKGSAAPGKSTRATASKCGSGGHHSASRGKALCWGGCLPGSSKKPAGRCDAGADAFFGAPAAPPSKKPGGRPAAAGAAAPSPCVCAPAADGPAASGAAAAAAAPWPPASASPDHPCLIMRQSAALACIHTTSPCALSQRVRFAALACNCAKHTSCQEEPP